jgi:hypothetical protein
VVSLSVRIVPTAMERGPCMEFLMSMLAPADRLGEAAPAEVVAAVDEFAMRLAAEGRLRDGRRLRDGGFRIEPAEDAGRVVDGPFTEAKELIGGYFVVECDTVEEARELAVRNPHRRIGPVVMQPVLPYGT